MSWNGIWNSCVIVRSILVRLNAKGQSSMIQKSLLQTQSIIEVSGGGLLAKNNTNLDRQSQSSIRLHANDEIVSISSSHLKVHLKDSQSASWVQKHLAARNSVSLPPSTTTLRNRNVEFLATSSSPSIICDRRSCVKYGSRRSGTLRQQ